MSTETAKKVGISAALGSACGMITGIATQAIAAASVPTLMSSLGTVVPGVGTIIQSGGIVSTVQMIAAGSLGSVAIPVTSGAAIGYGIYRTMGYLQKHKEQE